MYACENMCQLNVFRIIQFDLAQIFFNYFLIAKVFSPYKLADILQKYKYK